VRKRAFLLQLVAFSEEAIDYAQNIGFKKNNSNRRRALSEYMNDFNLGTSTAGKIAIKRVIQITLQKSTNNVPQD